MRFDDFMQDAIGDFPAGWNTNAAAEVVTIDGKDGRWLSFTRGGVFVRQPPRGVREAVSDR